MHAIPLLIGLACAGQTVDLSQARPDLRCGGYCLYLALRAVDRPVADYKALEAALGQPSNLGYSMQQLAEAARGFGAYAEGVETSLGSLRRRRGRFAAIALLEEKSHFVCIYDAEGGKVSIIDPPDKREVAADAFSTLWKGHALLISDRPIAVGDARSRWWIPAAAAASVAALALVGLAVLRSSRRSRRLGVVLIGVALPTLGLGCGGRRSASVPTIPRIEVSPKAVEFGRVSAEPGGKLTTRLRVLNRGTGPLRILQVSSSCGCTLTETPPEPILPGREGVIRVAVDPGIESGTRQSLVYVVSDDPSGSMVEVPLRWIAEAPLVLDPTELDLGRLRPGERVERTVAVRVKPPHHSTGFRAVADRDQVEGRLELDGSGGCRLIVGLRADASMGEQSASVQIEGAASGLRTRLPIRWRVAPEVDVSPPALFQGGVAAGAALEATLTISAAGAPFRITELTVDGEASPDLPAPTGAAAEHVVKIRKVAPSARGLHRSRVRVVTDRAGAGTAEVSWSIVVR